MPTAVTARWNAGGHDHRWADAANWNPAAPGAGIVAWFGRDPAHVDLAAAAARLLVGQVEVRGGSVLLTDGTLHFNDQPYDHRFFADVGLRVDAGGKLLVGASAALLGIDTMLLGDVSAATLDVFGTIAASQFYAGRGGAVSILVDGPNAHWTVSGIDQSFQLGGAAPVAMTVRQGGHVADGAVWTNPTANSTATIGGSTATASVLVTDPGSEFRFALLDVGGAYSGTLDIAHGGLVLDRGATVGEFGDGTVVVDGRGSAWNNLDGLSIDGTAPHGSVSVVNGGTLRFGVYGLQLGGSLAIDAASRLLGDTLVMAGGNLTAIAQADGAGATVTIGQTIALSENPALGGSNAGNIVSAAPGVTLVLAGAIAPSGGYDPLTVGGGHVVLTNAGNGDFAMALFGGVLELAPGASGTGGISFLQSAGATLEVDQTGTLANAITGFASNGPDVIDLAAIDAGTHASLAFLPQGKHAPLLAVSDGTHEAVLQLGSGYKLENFKPADDGHGGTALSYRA